MVHALYIADWGNLLEPPPGGPTIPNSGVVWKIMPVAGNQTNVTTTTSTANELLHNRISVGIDKRRKKENRRKDNAATNTVAISTDDS